MGALRRLRPGYRRAERKIPVEVFNLNGDKLNREEALEGQGRSYGGMVNERLTGLKKFIEKKCRSDAGSERAGRDRRRPAQACRRFDRGPIDKPAVRPRMGAEH